MANERVIRRKVLVALGANPNAAQNEDTYEKAIAAALASGANTKTKPQIVALTGASTAADIVAALKA